jgi:hypothetical protein
MWDNRVNETKVIGLQQDLSASLLDRDRSRELQANEVMLALRLCNVATGACHAHRRVLE